MCIPNRAEKIFFVLLTCGSIYVWSWRNKYHNFYVKNGNMHLLKYQIRWKHGKWENQQQQQRKKTTNQLSIFHMNLFADNTFYIANLLLFAGDGGKYRTHNRIAHLPIRKKYAAKCMAIFKILGGWFRNLTYRDVRINLYLFFFDDYVKQAAWIYLKNNILHRVLFFSFRSLKSFTRRSNCNHCKCLQAYSTTFVSVNKFQMNCYACKKNWKRHMGRHKFISWVMKTHFWLNRF